MKDIWFGVELSKAQIFGYKLCKLIAKVFKVNCQFNEGFRPEVVENTQNKF